jgi:nucleotide-binding universal stress UspA family protein
MKKAKGRPSRNLARGAKSGSPKPKHITPAKRVEQVLVVPPAGTSLPIQRILVPMDFSVHSKNALRYAIAFAEQFGASLHLIYVVEPTIYPADLGFGQVVMPDVEEELRERGFEELKALVEREIGERVKATSTVRTGKPHQEILVEAEGQKADLIIVASHGHTGVEQILFGSTAMRIVRLAKCPVLTVRPQAEKL